MAARQLQALILDTLRDAWSRKLVLATALSAAVSSALLVWYMRTLASRAPHATLTVLAQHDPRYLDNAFAARDILAATCTMGFWTQIAFTILLSTGALGLLLAPERNAMIAATPAPRGLLLLGRYLGCMLVALGGIALTFGAVLAAGALEFHVWHWRFLAGIATAWIAVGGTLAFLAMIQVAANSAAVATVSFTGLAIVSVGAQYPERIQEVTGSAALASACTMLGKLLPRTGEIAHWTAIYVNSGVATQAGPLYATVLSAILILAAAGGLYARREF